jgi:8-oxo-dGTP pyrophosphatase MutT (NUDIX family)
VPPEGEPSAPVSWIDQLRARLESRERLVPEPAQGERRAAVLVPLFVRDGGLWILLTRRTETLEHHRGQISFPGGAEEAEDESLYQTAVRESEEEIGLLPSDVRYLGALSPLTTVTEFYVEPFVAAIPFPYPFRPQESEIAELIEVPIAKLLDPRALERRLLPGREQPTLFYHHGRHVIWGATARMVKELLDAIE